MNDWISVKDKIPASGETVIACNNQNQVDACDFIHTSDDQFREDYPRITHWMPLPKPPVEN